MGTVMRRLVLLRHGESTANADGLFTGSLDAPLTPRGIRESLDAAELIVAADIAVDAILTSPLSRAHATATLAAPVLAVDPKDVQEDWRLTERSYGALTGRSKAEVLRRYGAERFFHWRRSMDGTPPRMSEALHHRLAEQASFRELPPEAVPYTESLRDVVVRVDAFLQEAVFPLSRMAQTVLIVAHGNSLRAVCAVLDSLRDDEVSALNIPTGHPLVYELDPELMPLARGGRYLDEKSASAAAADVAAQGGT